MKLKLCFLVLLCPVFKVFGQAGQEQFQNISIGQKVPDVVISHISNLHISGQPVTTMRLSALSGKLVILDFWATWCAPCRAMVPVMDSLQKVFKDKVQFLPVTYQSEAEIAPVIKAIRKNRDFDLPEITGDKVLARLFPHRTLPHYVWIDGSGIVRAITEFKEVNAANIRKLLATGSLDVSRKNDLRVTYNSNLPLLLQDNAGDLSTLKYHSLLTGFMPGISGGMQITAFDTLKGQKFTVRNSPFVNLCKFMFQDNSRYLMDAQVKISSKDSLLLNSRLSGQAYEEWLQRGNGYCYELVLPPALAANAFVMMQQDLQRLFPRYVVSVIPQQTTCIALVKTPGSKPLPAGSGNPTVKITPYSCELKNATIGNLMLRLTHQYLQNSPLPVIDLSGCTSKADLSFTANLWDIDSLNEALAPYGLAFVKREAMVDMLVIADATEQVSKPNKQPNP